MQSNDNLAMSYPGEKVNTQQAQNEKTIPKPINKIRKTYKNKMERFYYFKMVCRIKKKRSMHAKSRRVGPVCGYTSFANLWGCPLSERGRFGGPSRN